MGSLTITTIKFPVKGNAETDDLINLGAARYAVVMSVLNFPNVRHAAAVRRCLPPPETEALQSLPRVDYRDAFEIRVAPGSGADPVAWAQAVFDLRSRTTGPLLRTIALGLGATPVSRSPSAAFEGMHMGGRVWGVEIVSQTSNAVCAEMLTRLGLVQLVVFVDADARRPRLVLATFIAFSGPLGRTAFELAVGPAHRRVVPLLLAHAVATRP